MTPLGDSAAALSFERTLDDRLSDGLATAQHSEAITCIALPAPSIAVEAIVAAWPSPSLVVWANADTAVVGVGSAREFRGSGATRFAEVITAAHRTRIATRVGNTAWMPRVLGGFAFAAHAADSDPWREFGDAWFVLPRWTYSHDGWLVLAVDAHEARDGARWHRELEVFRACFARGDQPRPSPASPDSGTPDFVGTASSAITNFPRSTQIPSHRNAPDPDVPSSIDARDADLWRDNVRSIVAAISRREYAKVVAARHARVTVARPIQAADLLAELRAQQGDCTRLLVRPGSGATLVAATPERLVKVAGTRVDCDALAGSQPRSREPSHELRDEATLLGSAKDRQEHALVVEAIVAALQQLGGAVESRREPTIRALRDVLHLHTPVSARLTAKRHVLELVSALHPTPAMGGTPTAAATAWITAHEAARGWYASPVGWFDLDGNGEFAVAIRCGLVADRRDSAEPECGVIDVWAGAGIVSGSDPDRELAETEVKLRAILGALGVDR